jgi:hypothetical protein
MTPSLQAPEQDLEGGSDSASVSADPVHTGNRRFETSEDTREEGALPKHKGEIRSRQSLSFYGVETPLSG